jgi:hypothetical protein
VLIGVVRQPPLLSFVLLASSSALPIISLSSSTSLPAPDACIGMTSRPYAFEKLPTMSRAVSATLRRAEMFCRWSRSCKDTARMSARPHAVTRSNHALGSGVTLMANPWDVMR